MSSDVADRLDAIRDLLSTRQFQRLFPREVAPFTLIEMLVHLGKATRANDIQKALDSALAHRRLVGCPIIALLGQLNGGKSSVVATFLSEKGRRLLPRGDDSKSGTNRFVYWVPSSWMKDGALKIRFLDLLATAHGRQREDLATDPERAAQQYASGRDKPDILNIPLIARDDNLDSIGAAFLDCPDIQRRDVPGEYKEGNQRLDFLMNAARLCSAFLFVWELIKIPDRWFVDVLGQLRHRIKSAPLYLLMNKICPTTPLTKPWTDEEIIRRCREFNISRYYWAYDFGIEASPQNPGWRALTPIELVNCFKTDDPLPQFFAIPDEEPHDLSGVTSEYYLSSLPKQLDAGELQRQKLSDSFEELQKSMFDSLTDISIVVDERNDITKRFYKYLLSFCHERFRDRDTGAALQALIPSFGEAWQQSLIRTAPRYIRTICRFNLWTASRFNRTLATLKKQVERIRLLNDPLTAFQTEAHNALRKESNNIKSSNAQTIADEFLGGGEDNKCLENVSKDDVVRAWEEILTRFRNSPFSFDESELDVEAAKFWENQGAGRRLLTMTTHSLRAMLLPFLAVSMIDFGLTGASVLWVSSIAGAIPGAAGAGAASAAGAAAIGGGILPDLVKVNTLPSLARFFAIACDVFGLPSDIRGVPRRVSFGVHGSHELPNVDIRAGEIVCMSRPFELWDLPNVNHIYEVLRGS